MKALASGTGRRASLALAWAWASGLAMAAPFQVESGPIPERAEAESLAERVEAEVDVPVTVTRRYVRGEGWRFVVRVGAFDDREAAEAVLDAVGGPGRPARLVDLDGKRVVAVGSAAAELPPPAAPGGSVEEPGPRLPEASEVLRAAVRAHGGRGGGMDVLARAATVDLVFERRVALPQGPLVVRHHLRRADGRWRLDVEVLEGQGVDSTTLVDADGRAWVVVDGEATERDRVRTLEVLDAFAPERLLGLPLRLPGDAGRSPTWDGLRTVAVEGDLVVLGRDGEDPGLREAAFDRETGTLARVRWRTEDGDLEYDYADYREVARGLVVPFAVDIRRAGAVIESLRIEELRLDAPLDAATFTLPAGEGGASAAGGGA